jgi:tetratricopeptide (TPR) repeat protein
LLESRRITVAFAFERLDEAYDIALRYLDMCSTDFRRTHAHSVLCRLSYIRGDLEGALGHSRASETYARREVLKSSIALAQAWQALFLRKQGDEENARRLYRQATSAMASLGVKPGNSYYDALCEYHEFNSDSDQALSVREQQITETVGASGYYSECEVYLRYLRLLGRMGKPLDEPLAAARKSGEALLNPVIYLAKLEKIVQGDFSEPY